MFMKQRHYSPLFWTFFGLLLLILFGLMRSIVAQEKPGWMELGSLAEASDIPASQYPVLADWLEKNGKSPLDYAVEKCREHQIVIFGELHGIKDYLDLFHQIIPRAYHQAGMRYVVLEVAKYEDNEKIARLVEGQSFDRDLALEIARNAGWSTWNSKEYWDVFEVVWKLNRSLPAGAEHMKVIGMDVSVNLELEWMRGEKKLKDPKLISQAQRQGLLISNRDELMASAIDTNIIRNDSKGMVWVGFNHSFTHYGQPFVNKDGLLLREFHRMGYLLHQRFGERIFQIGFHYQFDSPSIIHEGSKGPEPLFTNMLEKIMKLRQDRPVGWDVFTSPFGQIRDKYSYYFHFQPSVRFADLSRGYIFLKPWARLSPCLKIRDFITEAMFLERKAYYEARFKKTFKNAEEVNEMLEGR